MIMNSRKRKTILNMTWTDNKKAFNIPLSWLIISLQIYDAENNTNTFL